MYCTYFDVKAATARLRQDLQLALTRGCHKQEGAGRCRTKIFSAACLSFRFFFFFVCFLYLWFLVFQLCVSYCFLVSSRFVSFL